MNKSLADDFERCTSTLFDGDSWDISCKLGLWSVSSDCKEDAQEEALECFIQCKSDGGYSSILGFATNCTQVKKDQVSCMVNTSCNLKISHATQLFFENDFDLHGVDHDIANARWCTLKHEQTGVIVKLEARMYFGTKVILVEDPNSIVKEKSLN